MSSYFDEMARDVSLIDATIFNDDEYVEEVAKYERQVHEDVSAVMAAPEFPTDLRERVEEVFEYSMVYRPDGGKVPEMARTHVLVCLYSRAIENLHSIFHDVARRRVQTSFGLLSDHPAHDRQRKEESR